MILLIIRSVFPGTPGFALAYNLGNFLRRLALPRKVSHWSLTTLREKLVKIGANLLSAPELHEFAVKWMETRFGV